jgi:uncharacterized hydrophobic protein (TIGR00271 family)
MSVAVLVTEAKQSSRLIPWAALLAQTRRTDLLVIVPQKEKGKRCWKKIDFDEGSSAIAKAVAKTARELNLLTRRAEEEESALYPAPDDETVTDMPSELRKKQPQQPEGKLSTADANGSHPKARFQVELQARYLCDPRPAIALVDEVPRLSISLLIIPAVTPSKTDESSNWQNDLFRNSPCDVMYLRDDENQNMDGTQVLVVTNGDIDDQLALQTGTDIAELNNGLLTASYVEPEIDVVAPLVGQKILDKIVRNSLGKRESNVVRKVVLADDLLQGYKKLDPDQYDLILIGTRERKEIRAVLFSDIGGPSADRPATAVAIIRRGIPFSSRLWMSLRQSLERYVPQLERAQRISLVERLQSNSHWDFDFSALIFLSTLIAALGLIQNSPAVVIGAMLVAPLMTPIVAIGLGLAQSNIHFIRVATKTVMGGFLTAIIVSFFIGLLFAPAEATHEMIARESPNFRDLIIALASGIAAAYAMGRPNLLSALPGVAIAAALVPPVATAGIGAAKGHWHIAGGSLLLFFTNIVAIVLGTAFTFWAVGLTRSKNDKQSMPSWPRWAFLGLVVLTIVLTAVMTYY